MEEREPTIKILYENTEKPINQMWLTFPLSGREKAEQRMLALTRGHEKEESIPFRISRVESPIPNLGRYLPADGWFQEISRLAEKIEGMALSGLPWDRGRILCIPQLCLYGIRAGGPEG